MALHDTQPRQQKGDRRKNDDTLTQIAEELRRTRIAHWMLAFAACAATATALTLGLVAWEAIDRQRTAEDNRVLNCFQLYDARHVSHPLCRSLDDTFKRFLDERSRQKKE